MVLQELLALADLIRTQAFYIYKLMEVVMVGKNDDFVFTTF